MSANTFDKTKLASKSSTSSGDPCITNCTTLAYSAACTSYRRGCADDRAVAHVTALTLNRAARRLDTAINGECLHATCSAAPPGRRNNENARFAIDQKSCARSGSPPTGTWQERQSWSHSDNSLQLPTSKKAQYRHARHHMIRYCISTVQQQEVKVIWQKAPHGVPFPG